MKKKISHCLLFLACVIHASGCTGLLPRAEQVVRSPWNSFDEAKAAFDRIVPYTTTIKELHELGFDPHSTANIRILTYLNVMNRFMPNPSIRKEDLDPGIQSCIDAKANCLAYEFEPKVLKSRRYGNFWADLFNFKRMTEESGWQFEALIVLIGDTVVYKLWGGRPIIDETRETVNPLGPLQSPENIVREAATPEL